MMRRFAFAILTVFAFTVSPAGAKDPSPRNPRIQPNPNSAAQLLLKNVELVDWEDVTFEEVMEWLNDRGDGEVNIIPRWNALGVEAVTRESLVTLRLKNVPVSLVLNEVSEYLSEDDAIAYQAVGNTLRISTKNDFNRKLYLRVYDAADILFRVPDFGAESPKINLQQVASSSGGGGGGGQSIFSGGSSGGGGGSDRGGLQSERKLEEKLEDLRDLILVIIEPQSWANNGGPGQSRIEVYNTSLFVNATVEVHEQIAGLLAFE